MRSFHNMQFLSELGLTGPIDKGIDRQEMANDNSECLKTYSKVYNPGFDIKLHIISTKSISILKQIRNLQLI